MLRLITLFLLTLAVVICSGRLSAASRTLTTQLYDGGRSVFVQGIATPPSHPSLSDLTLNLAQPGPEEGRITPKIQILYDYYSVTGTTARALRKQMAQYGPLDSMKGQRYDARTDWVVQWSFSSAQNGDHCAIETARSTVTIKVTLPQWVSPGSPPDPLIHEWQQYLLALHLHEKGHQQYGIAAATEVLARLSNFPPYPSCQGAEAAAHSAAQSIIKYFNQQDITYDNTTKHGYTQGAIFPAHATALR